MDLSVDACRSLDVDLSRRALAHSLRIDLLAVEVVGALEAVGIDALVLKGPTIASWLWPRELRPYGDLDLLVAPSAYGAAGRVLAGLGFVDPLAHARPSETEPNARAWRRRDGLVVDLHLGIVGIDLDHERAWTVLWSRRAPVSVAGTNLLGLDEAGRAMHVVLHAAQHGSLEAKPQRDLERALERLSVAVWQEALTLANSLNARAAFAGGLRMVAHGRDLARRLALDDRATVEVALRLDSAPHISRGFNRLAGTTGTWNKLVYLLSRFAPSPAFLRSWSPLARRGRIGLLLAYPMRGVHLLVHALPGLVRYRQARAVVARADRLHRESAR